MIEKLRFVESILLLQLLLAAANGCNPFNHIKIRCSVTASGYSCSPDVAFDTKCVHTILGYGTISTFSTTVCGRQVEVRLRFSCGGLHW
jgi:hypothetical protein